MRTLLARSPSTFSFSLLNLFTSFARKASTQRPFSPSSSRLPSAICWTPSTRNGEPVVDRDLRASAVEEIFIAEIMVSLW